MITLKMGEILHMSTTFEPRNWPRQAWKQRSGMPKRKDKSMNWTMKLPPYSMLNKAKRETLKRPNVAAKRANMGDMLCGQMPPSFRRDSSSGSTFPSAFRFLLCFSKKKNFLSSPTSNLHKNVKRGIETTFHLFCPFKMLKKTPSKDGRNKRLKKGPAVWVGD